MRTMRGIHLLWRNFRTASPNAMPYDLHDFRVFSTLRKKNLTRGAARSYLSCQPANRIKHLEEALGGSCCCNTRRLD